MGKQPRHSHPGWPGCYFFTSHQIEGRWIDEYEYGSQLVYCWSSDPDDRDRLHVEHFNNFELEEFANFLRSLVAPR